MSASSIRLQGRRLAGFAIAGLVLWLAARGLATAPAPTELAVHVAARASAAEIELAIDEAVLVEAAFALGLPYSDPFVRARVVEVMRAADPGATTASDDALLQRAWQLGLVRAHPLLRARIAAAMERRLVADIEAPDDAMLTEYLHAHAGRYARAPRIDLEQVMIGAPSMLPRELVRATPAQVEATFGPELAAAASSAVPGSWTGPVRSSYGVHWLHVRAREPGGMPELAELRARLVHDWAHDRRRTERAARLAVLREAHAITIVRAEALP